MNFMKAVFLLGLISNENYSMAFSDSFEIARIKTLEADQETDKLQKELKWYFDFRNELASDGEKSLKNQGMWDKQILQNQELKIKLGATLELLKKFRENAARSLSLSSESDTGQAFLEATVYLDITEWFVKYVENTLFPQGWEDTYQEFKKKRATLDKEISG
jgi:hypothetical protein